MSVQPNSSVQSTTTTSIQCRSGSADLNDRDGARACSDWVMCVFFIPSTSTDLLLRTMTSKSLFPGSGTAGPGLCSFLPFATSPAAIEARESKTHFEAGSAGPTPVKLVKCLLSAQNAVLKKRAVSAGSA